MRPIRRSQAVTPFGVGAMVDFPGPVSLIHAGLDAWPFDENNPEHAEFRIEDEDRLATRLGVRYFVQPPDFRYVSRGSGRIPNLNLKLPFLRFPLWHVCPRCGLMHASALHDFTAPICEGPIGSGKDKGRPHSKRKTVQVRFVAACVQGHLQDFPWWEWVLQNPNPQTKEFRLRLNTTGSASLAGVRIMCERNSNDIDIVARKTLAGAFDYEPGQGSILSGLGITCRGNNPSLAVPSAGEPPPGCGDHLYPLLRGGSNVYFPHVVSAIYLPPQGEGLKEEILEILENPRAWQFIRVNAKAMGGSLTEEGASAVLSEFFPNLDVSAEELASAANAKLESRNEESVNSENPSGCDTDEETFRREEYELFRRDVQEGYPKTNLLVRVQNIDAYGGSIRESFSHIALLHKLRETRVFTGFTRIFPDNDQSDEERRTLIGREPKDWLPAITVRGEGIFLVLDEERLSEWIRQNRDALDKRLSSMRNSLDQLRTRRQQEPRSLMPRFLLLHTLSHLLINQLVYECGYGSASLRERIYCSDDANDPMAAILIYTAAGDAEGTMGGLVRMGRPRRIEGVLQRAIAKAAWCSTDPVCIESHGQGPDNCNLAACHACALLPETSCEEQNRLLDRGVIVGTLDSPSLGFFAAGSIHV